MPIEMPKGLPFSVDTFSPSSKRKRHHFLTHAHKDHTSGISTHFSYPIYSTHLTKSIVLQYCPQLDDSLFVGIEVGESVVVDDPDGEFKVTAFDANHCPGAVMFLFEGSFGNILHTGDCRLTPECIQNLPEKYIGKKGKEPQCRLDYVFLDCTFGRFNQGLPSKHSAIRQVINCIWKHPNAPTVYLTCDLLGQEEILASVFKTFGSKIYVDESTSPDFFQSLKIIVPDILSEDPSSRFQVFGGFPKLSERATATLAEAQANFRPEPLIIRPSAMWYACEEEHSEIDSRRKIRFNEAIKDQFGVWHVCYSMHSSREELEWTLTLLAPKRVVSTTPSCRAMELNYVKKHCLNTKISSDDPLWKLLDIDVEACPQVNSPIKSLACSPIVEGLTQTYAECEPQPQPINVSSCRKMLLTLSPPSKRPPVTLFGRARLGLPDSNYPHEAKMVSVRDNSPCVVIVNKMEQRSIIPEDSKDGSENRSENKVEAEDAALQFKNLVRRETCEERLKNKIDANSSSIRIEEIRIDTYDENRWENKQEDGTAMQCEKLMRTETHNKYSYSIGSSKGYSDSFRKLYRSMNAPVPRPLPSLVELMKACKRSRRV